MKLSFSAFLTSFYLLFPLMVSALPISSVPDELMYLGKPIDPLCFFETVDTQGQADLKTCGLHAQQGRKNIGQNDKLIAQGFIGYNYSVDMNGSSNTRCYSYYKSFGRVGHSTIVETLNNSGGTGSFSSLNIVSREGGTIKISTLDGGDRCNGGLVDMKRVGKGPNARLIYGVHLTAFDFLALAHDNPHQLKAYDDLASCAVCCIATAVYQRNIHPDAFSHEKLLYVDVSMPVPDAGHSQFSPKYQDCFDKLLRDYQQENHTKLDPKQLTRFTHQFNAQCIR